MREGFAIADGKNIYLDQQGQPIVDTFYPTSNPEIPPIVGIKRAMLHRVLAGRMQALNVDIRLGCSLQSLDNANPESVSVVLSDEPTRYSMFRRSQSQMACTRGSPGSTAPNSCRAAGPSRSASQ